ncbi:unnamed protein product [Dovyalis caffra]|uniref:Coenzyme Q-binding protein COQ10 START domain-containing protein n=1 Tax=Dovyalis caffra TaxID=77055 RepID=A0AAV1SBY1_9ROSI|nr:unnamed protein product [Dovyalis caffra]
MSAAATTLAHLSTPTSFGHSHLSTTKNKSAAILSNSVPTCKITSSSVRKVQYGYRYSKRSSTLPGFKPFSSPVMEWQDCTVKMEIDVPVGAAYKLYSDRESIPRWMPFISSVQVLKDKPDLSRWSLKYKALGQDIEYSWLARNMQPTPNQKIHWRSLEGLPNSMLMSFSVEPGIAFDWNLTVSYEVPQLLVPVATALQPLLESLLRVGLERFATLAKSTLAD